MIFIIIGIILGIVCGINEGKNLDEKIGLAILNAISGGIIGTAVMLVISLIAMVFNWDYFDTATSIETHELVQISDHVYSNVSGSISGVFLVRGSIGTNLSAGFSFYQKEVDGFSLKTVEASNTTIKYTDVTPRIETTHTYCLEKVHIRPLWISICLKGNIARNTIYVPENSIVESFNLGDNE